jgi:hypothetical protein
MTRTCILGLMTNVLLASACASGGATSAPMRSDPPAAANAVAIARWTCTSNNTTVAPADGLISDFSDKGGLPGRIDVSVPTDAVPGVILSQTMDAGRLAVEIKAAPGPKPQVLTVTRPFDGCVDARGFAGVQFSLSGSLSGCAMTYATIDPAHQYYEAGGPYPPQKRIAADEVASASRTITAPFQKSEIQGNPATPVDPAQLAAIQWAIMVPVAPDDGSAVSPCTGEIFIDDVKLYR